MSKIKKYMPSESKKLRSYIDRFTTIAKRTVNKIKLIVGGSMSTRLMFISSSKVADYLVLNKLAVADLYEYLFSRMPTISPDYIDQFEGEYLGEAFSIVELPAKDYHKVYQAIMQAADELSSVRPFKNKLKAALEADPRFKAI